MARTQTEIESDIARVNAALEELVSGGRLTRLQLGSGEFARTYEFQELTYENLMDEKARLQAELEQLLPETITYRSHDTLPLKVNKFNRV